MNKNDAKLLQNTAVRKEIKRYKWIESEKAGCDIGQERAEQEWLELYSNAWGRMHPLNKKPSVKKGARAKKTK
jgi:hypothetical protein